MNPDWNLTKTDIVHSSPNGLHSDLEAASEAESNPSDAESISESNNYQTNNCSSVSNGKKIKSSFRSTFNLPGAVKNMLQVHLKIPNISLDLSDIVQIGLDLSKLVQIGVNFFNNGKKIKSVHL